MKAPVPVATGPPARTAITTVVPALIWVLLLFNATSYQGKGILPIGSAAKVIRLLALLVALALAVLWNRAMLIRPDLILSLFSLLAVAGLASGVFADSGTGVSRSARLILVIATLWILTRAWSDPLALVRTTIWYCLGIVGLVLLGVVVTGGNALNRDHGRLPNVIWAMPPTAVTNYISIGLGLLVCLWMSGLISGQTIGIVAPLTSIVILFAHGRTGIAAMIAGLLMAGGSAYLGNRRAGRFVGGVVAIGCIGTVLAGPLLVWYLERGQSGRLSQLSGRQKVWDQLLAVHRPLGEQIFGLGLTDKSFNGHPIDNSWLAVYQDQGILGVAIFTVIFLALVLTVIASPPSPRRIVAVFSVTFLLATSYTENGFGDVGVELLLAVLVGALVNSAHRAEVGGDP